MVCVPLTADDKVLGVMQLLNKRGGDYTDRDRVILEHFASQAAVAIRNARLVEDLLAHMGLYTSRTNSKGPFELMQELKMPARMESLTVMFADMRGFTQLCQVLNDPREMQRRLNEFLTMLSSAVISFDGLVNKFLGDGLLALFRNDNHEERAVRCAFRMVEQFKELSIAWEEQSNESLEFLDIGVGIATDSVIIGSIGSERVRDFTVFGSAVNLAAAFEQHAREGRRIFVDQRTYSAVKSLVAQTEGPETFLLRKPDQTVGHAYKQYHLKSLSPACSDRIFVSHSHTDRDFVERHIVEPLRTDKIDTWYSQDDVGAGEVWVNSICRGLEKCNWVVVVVSANGAASEWVRKEVMLAYSDPRLEERVIPVILDLTDPRDITPWLGTAQTVNESDPTLIATRLRDRIRQVSCDRASAGSG
jgi:class 3 adenylate cyclase